MNTRHEAKVKWVQLSTGASESESRKFLELAKWKVYNAIIEMRRAWKEESRKNNGNR